MESKKKLYLILLVVSLGVLAVSFALTAGLGKYGEDEQLDLPSAVYVTLLLVSLIASIVFGIQYSRAKRVISEIDVDKTRHQASLEKHKREVQLEIEKKEMLAASDKRIAEKLSATCAHCGSKLGNGEKHCPGCGSRA